MKTKIWLIIAAGILLGVSPMKASTITFSSGHYTWTDADPYYDEVFVVNEAILDFTGGGIGKLEGFHNALINITGGTMDQLWAGDEVIVNIYECMDLDILEASENSIMNLYTNDFTYSPTGGDMDQGYIEGFYYGTTTAFYISFYDDTTYSHVNTIPEPQPNRVLNVNTGELFSTIQEAIDACVDGDVVLVAPGTYTGPGNRDIDFEGKAITVRSTDPNDPNIVAATIIDCNGTETDPHRGFYFHNGEDANSVLAGLTIINGYDSYGGGIFCGESSPSITNCTFRDNSAEFYGGGIGCDYYSGPTITDCTISDNFALVGGGVCCHADSNPMISNCAISGNSAEVYGGGISCVVSHPTITNCIIAGNSARLSGGIDCWSSSPTITNCTISGNLVDAIICHHDSNLTISNSIVWANEPQYQIYVDSGSNLWVTYTDLQGGQDNVYIGPSSTLNWGPNNIDADPCFVSPGYWGDVNDPNIPVAPNNPNAVWVDGNYHLLRTSPCIDAANDVNVYTDIEGNIRPFDFPRVDNNGELPEFDMGAYEATAREANLWVFPKIISRQGWMEKILAWVRLPEGITEDEIDSNEPLLLYPGGIEAVHQYVIQYHRRGTWRTSIFAFFDKAELMDAVLDNGRAELQVLGQFVKAGKYFYGSDMVWIIDWPGGPTCIVDLDYLERFSCQWLQTGPDLEADLDKNGRVDLRDFAILANNWLDVCPQ